ncbi:MAG TPA: diacylglycerol kinase family protein [Candidatus Acidoferrales bacterium]|nr:diacylglycerol kinase family protein [Candidatus Acidoferrales bacterium]
MNPLARPLVIVNPSAGHGRAARVRDAVESYWRRQGVVAEFCEPASREEVRRRSAEAAAAGYSCVVALGGDGTAHDVINGMNAAPSVVGILPAGGGNDLARALGLPLEPIEAAHTLLHAPTRRIDLLRLTAAAGRTCLYAGAGGAGIDAEAARLGNTRFRRVPGVSRYVAAAIAAFHDSRPLEITLHADDATSRRFRALLVAVANTPSYGSGVIIAPDARIDDGWMDLAIVAPLDWSHVLDGLLLALRNGDIRWPEMQRLRARKLRIETDRPAIFHGDGEVLGETPVEIEVLPRALEVLSPRSPLEV